MLPMGGVSWVGCWRPAQDTPTSAVDLEGLRSTQRSS